MDLPHDEADDRRSKLVVAYLFCEYDLRQEQTATILIQSLIRQLILIKRAVPQSVLEFQGRQRTGNTNLSLEEALYGLHLVLSCFESVYIIIDGLDNCESHILNDLLNSLSSILTSNSNVSMMLTFRNSPRIVDQMAAFDGQRIDWLTRHFLAISDWSYPMLSEETLSRQ